MTHIIRPARLHDLNPIKTMVDEAYGIYVPRMGRKPGPMLDDHRAFIDDGHSHVLEVAGIVVGLIVLIPDLDALLIQNVAVNPHFKGQGHGRTLLQFAEHEARRLNSTVLTLYTHVSMVENIALYGRIGFTETHRVTEGGLHRVYMKKSVS